ncbi:MAG: hypothetical protein AB7K24_31280, partial [Gemmataceae bacterium]
MDHEEFAGNGESPGVRFQRALACYQSGDFEGANAAFSGLLALDPTHLEARRQRASNHQHNGQYALALADYDVALQYEPQNA